MLYPVHEAYRFCGVWERWLVDSLVVNFYGEVRHVALDVGSTI